ncbi:MAG TPA: hypothetical protein VHD33_01990, partial [Legionellaceae bacterium]|nr:hypothetical protein [Legionellaceae bacterium]
FIFAMGYASLSFSATDDTTPGMLSLVNRPTIAVSAFTMPLHEVMIESGYNSVKKTDQSKRVSLYPFTQIRTGLPNNGEFLVLLPIYVDNPVFPFTGWSPIGLGLKKEIYTSSATVFSLNGIGTLPSGSKYYGEQGFSGKLSGIIAHTFNNYFSVSSMLSVMYQNVSASQPDKQFASFNPDIVASFNITPAIVLYGEVYGQTRVSNTLGSGFNADEGFVFLVKDNMTMDIEISQRLSGHLGGFDSYIGAGFAIKLG